MNKVLITVLVLLTVSLSAFAAAEEEAAEKPTIHILSQNNWNFDPNENPMRAAIEEATGYEVEFAMTPQGNASNEMVVLELSSGTNYDLIFNTNKPLYFDLASSGALYQLDEVLEDYPLLQNVQPKPVWDELVVDGKVFGIPSKRHPKATYNAFLVRTDYLEDAGVDSIPTTLPEFVSALRAIEANTDIIPMGGRGTSFINWDQAQILSSAFGVSTYWKEIDGELVPRPLQPAMREYVSFLAELYAEGLIDPEFSALQREQLHEKISAGKIAFTPFGWGDWQSLVALEDNDPTATWQIMNPLADDNGNREMNLGQLLSNRIVLIPRDTDTLEPTMDFLNEFAKPENYTHIIIGEEGVHHQIVDGVIEAINPKFANEREMSWWYMLVTPSDLQSRYFELGPRNEHPMVWRVFEPLQENREWGIEDPTAYLPATPAEAEYSRSLGQLANDYYTQFVTGVRPMSEYDDFIELWLSEGGQEIIDQTNALY